MTEASGGYHSQFIEENIEQGSMIITDGWTGYNALANSEKYKHEIKVIF